ncbi:MAG: SDR family NAD(P)-dependent oxidoreductase, partial [Sphingobacterium sp.]
MNRLKDKVILISGGTAGIGLACAQAYAKAGAQVAFIGLDQASVAATGELLGTSHLGICADFSQEEDVKAAVDQTIA